MKRFTSILSLIELPGSIRRQILRYYFKKLLGRKPLNHETIWTSFLYFYQNGKIRFTESEKNYRIDFKESQKPLSVLIRKDKSSDVFVFFQVFISNEYQPLLDFLRSKKFTPATIVDAGANVGYFSLLLSREFHQPEIISIEPEHSNIQQLCENIKLNNYSAVKAIEAALWINQTSLVIERTGSLEWAFSVTEAKAGQKADCDAVSLRYIMQSYSMDYIDLLKMDIEGSEGVIFNDSEFQQLLTRIRVIAMEIHDHKVNRHTIHEILIRHNFEFLEKNELTLAWNKNFFS